MLTYMLPSEWTEITLEELDSTPQLRWAECPYYKHCLDLADDGNWESWTCLYCPYQDKYRKESK